MLSFVLTQGQKGFNFSLVFFVDVGCAGLLVLCSPIYSRRTREQNIRSELLQPFVEFNLQDENNCLTSS